MTISHSVENAPRVRRGADIPAAEPTDEAAKRQLNLSLQAFGKRIKLNLMKNEDFQRRVEGLKMYTMSTTSRGGMPPVFFSRALVSNVSATRQLVE